MKVCVEVICYKSKMLSNGEFPLMLRITKLGKRKYLSIGLSVNEKYWDFQKNKPKRNCPNRDKIEKIIANKKSEYNSLILDYATNQKQYTLQSLAIAIESKQQFCTVGEMFSKHIEYLHKNNRLGNFVKI